MRVPTRYELDPKAPQPEQPREAGDLDEVVDARMQAEQTGFVDDGGGA